MWARGFSYVMYFHIHLFILLGYITNSQYDQLPVDLIAQLVEHCTSIAEVMGSNPVQAGIFFRLSFRNCSSCVNNCWGSFFYLTFRLCLNTRRSLSVGDICDAYQDEEAAPRAQRVMPSLASQPQKRPVPTPRSDVEKTPVDLMGAPNEMAPPLPGGPQKHNRKPGKKSVVMNFISLNQTGTERSENALRY